MFTRLVQIVIRRRAGLPPRISPTSISVTAATKMAERFTHIWRGKELIEVSNVKPGEVIVIELLPISHKEQIKQFKKADRRARRAARQERRAARRG